MPLESCAKSSNKVHINVQEIYLLNSRTAMLFLHKLGMNNSFDSDQLSNHVKKFEDKFIDYKMKMNDDNGPPLRYLNQDKSSSKDLESGYMAPEQLYEQLSTDIN